MATGTTNDSGKWWVVAAMALPLFLLAADNFGVAVVIPQMGRDLNANVSEANWFYNAFLLSFAAIQLPVGRLADLVGRKKVLIAGILTFTGSSVLCGLAPNAILEIVARAFEGAGAAMLYATTLSIVSNAFPPEERGTGIGIWSGIGIMGGALGPFLGGLLTQTLGWRFFFFVNVPITAIALFLTITKVEESRDENADPKIDWAGFVVVTAALVPFTYGINQAAAAGWASMAVLAPIGVGIFAFVGFVMMERSKSNALVDFSLFKTRNYLSASLVAFIGNYTFAVTMIFLAQYLQSEAVVNMSPMGSGVAFFAFSVPIVIASIFTGRIITAMRGMRLPMTLGSALIAASYVVLLRVNAGNAVTFVLISLLLAGVGEGLSYNVSTTAAMNEIPDSKAGVASGMIAVVRLMGMVFGVSITASLIKIFETNELSRLFNNLGASIDSADRSEVQGLLSGSDSASQRLAKMSGASLDQVNAVARDAFTFALHRAMAVTIVVAVVAIIGALAYRERTTAANEEAAEGEAAPAELDHAFTGAHAGPKKH